MIAQKEQAVIAEIGLVAVFIEEAEAVISCGQLGEEENHLLPFSIYLREETEGVGKLRIRRTYRLLALCFPTGEPVADQSILCPR